MQLCLSSCFFDHLEFILLPSVVRVLKNQLLQDQAIFLTTISIQVFLSVVKVPTRFDSRDHTQKNLTKFDCSHRFYEVMFRLSIEMFSLFLVVQISQLNITARLDRCHEEKNVFSGVWRSFHFTFHFPVFPPKFNNFCKVISDKSLLRRGFFFMFFFLSIKNKKKKRNKCFTLKS